MLHVRPAESLKTETTILRVLRQHFADPQNWSPRKVDFGRPYDSGPRKVLLYYPPSVAEVHKLGNFFADGIPSSSFDCVLKSMVKVGFVQMFRTICAPNILGDVEETKSQSYSTNVLYLSEHSDDFDSESFYLFFPFGEASSPLLTKEIPASVPEASCQSKQ